MKIPITPHGFIPAICPFYLSEALESGEHPLGLAAPQFLGFSTAMLNNQRISIHVYIGILYCIYLFLYWLETDSVYLHVYFFLHFFEDITSIFFMIIRTHISGSIPGANLNAFLQLSFYCGRVGKSFNPRCLIGWTLILDGYSLMQSTVFRTVCHRNDRSVNHFILWLNKQWHEVWFANTPCCMTLYEPETTRATSKWQETSRVTRMEMPSLAPGKSVSARFGKGLRIVRISVISTHSGGTVYPQIN